MPRSAIGLPLVMLAGCSVAPRMRSSPTEPEFRVLLAQGSGSNVAVTSDSAADPRLRTRMISGAPDHGRVLLLRAVTRLPRWHVVDSSGAVLWFTRRTRVFRFVDDLFLLVEPREGGSALLARSASRIGRGDFGQNRRNIAELWAALGTNARPAPVTSVPTSASSP